MRFPYQDPSLPVEERVEDLISRMTTREKVSQLNCMMGMGLSDLEKAGLDNGLGEMDLMSLPADQMAAVVTAVQDYMRDHTRLGIPVLFHAEALSGPLIAGGQCFPTSITLGATFDPEIVRDMCDRSRKQMTAVGIRQALSPVLDVTRDLRWGRVSETYGGDPTLCAAMGTAFVQGLQGDNLKQGAAATLKHFLGYSFTSGGLNMARTVTDDRDIRETFAKPFEAAIREGGVCSVMNSYSEYNGKPICASKEILTDLLREDLGFDGLVVSDYMSVDRLVNVFRMAQTPAEAGEICLAAGLDVECPVPYGYNDQMVADADAGKFDMACIDRSVRRILKLKFELGLFENPYPDTQAMAAAFDNTENHKKAREASMKAVTLTKNEGILPITDRTKKIAVIGPMGDAPRAFFAGYTMPSGLELMMGAGGMAGVDTEDMVTLGEGNPMAARKLPLHAADEMIRGMYPELKTTFEALKEEYANVTFVAGCDYNDPDRSGFAEAVAAAKDADIVIMTVGGRSGWGMFNNSGEGADSTHVGLPGVQEELVQAVYAANPNMVIAHTDARPLVSEWAYENVPAIVEGWLGGISGGIALAKTITGENNPGGRLQLNVPRNDGHTHLFHDAHNGTGWRSFPKGALNVDGYLNCSMKPRRPFGYGLSYTGFDYSDCRVTLDGLRVTASAAVTNTGAVAGDEVVQLYVSDKIASMIRPELELAGFCRVSLQPGERKRVELTFGLDQIAFRNDDGQWVVEAGEFDVSFGRDSEQMRFTETITLDKTYVIDHTKRGFFAKARVC